MTSLPPIQISWLGEVSYKDAWALQRALHERRVAGEIGDQLLLLSHPHTLTAGTRSGKPDRWANLRQNRGDLAEMGVDLIEADRGGDVTWHGPGQLVGYPIVQLDPYGRDVGRYVRMLEETVIKSLEALGIRGERLEGYPGVWIGDHKIAAIGARIRRWTTMHGFSFNVRGPLEGFDWILPCGLEGKGVTSVERQIPGGAMPDDEIIRRLVAASAGAVFDRAIQWRTAPPE